MARSDLRVLLAAFVLLAALFLSLGLAVGPSLDAAVFAEIGHQLRAGDRLYVDAWDHKPPGVYFVLALAQGALPFLTPWAVSWIVSVLATGATGVGLAYLVSKVTVYRWVTYLAPAIGVAFVAQYLTALGGGLTEPLAALPATWALWLVVGGAQSRWRRLTSGLLLGLALLTSLQTVPACVAIGGLGIASVERGHRWRAFVDLSAGATAPWLLCGVSFLAAGSLPAAIDAVVTYGAAYRNAGSSFGAQLSQAPAAWTLLSGLVLIVPAALGGLTLLKRGDQGRLLVPCLAGWVALAVALFVVQGRFIAHYAIPLAIPLVVLGSVGLDFLTEKWSRSNVGTRAALALPLAAALFISLSAAFVGGRYELVPMLDRHRQVDAVAAFVARHSDPSDRILVWGNVPQLYLAAARSPALPYPLMYPLTTDGYATADLIGRMRSDLSARPPLLIVDAGSIRPGAPGFLPLLIDRPVTHEGRELDLLGPLRDYVRANYDLIAEDDGWPIYRLRSTGSP